MPTKRVLEASRLRFYRRRHARSTQRLTAVDLFSGAGGMTLGLRRAGFSVVGAIEIDDLAAETYRANHPSTLLLVDDIRRIDADAFRRATLNDNEQLDLLAACPPCQGFSVIRTRRGSKEIKDHRNRLISEIIRFVDSLHPRFVLFENVPTVVTNWRFRKLCTALRRRGYSVDYAIENAANYGVAQRRLRLLMVAALNRAVSIDVKRRRRPLTVRRAFANLPPVGESGDPLHDYWEARAARINKLITNIPKDGGSRRDLPSKEQLACHQRFDGFYDVYGRMRWDDVAPTITGSCINPSKGRFLHPSENRAITLREAAILQSFPRSYKFSLRRGRYATAQMIGNALPPAVVSAQAKALLRSTDP